MASVFSYDCIVLGMGGVGSAALYQLAKRGGIVVETDRGRYHTDRLVITAGAWASEWLNALRVPFQVLRKPSLWYRTLNDRYHLERGFPIWLLETPTDTIYGFPEIDQCGVENIR